MLAALWCLTAAGQEREPLRVMFWNLENFFDYRNDSLSVADAEFSSRGARRWTRRRFDAKCNAIAKSILWTAGSQGGLPDIIGVAEVENAFVLRRLLQNTALSKLDYRIVHYDSPDPRGIDVALLYRASRCKLISSKPCHLYQEDGTVMATRDILVAQFTCPDGEDLAVMVNHHPSKYGGAASEPRRRKAVERLGEIADSLQNAGITRMVAMGDFNDTPDNSVYQVLEPRLHNLAASLWKGGRGTIKFDGGWELIDMFFVSDALAQTRMEIVRIPFLEERDNAHGGTKPLRTYTGPRHRGGVSDHCPIWLTVPQNP